jgi:CBS domain-containing protein
VVPVVRGTRVVGLVRPGAAGLAGEAMQPVGPADVVDASADLEEVRRRFVTGPRPLLVTDGGRLVGVVEPEDVAALPSRP